MNKLLNKIENKIDLAGLISRGRYYKRFCDDKNYVDFYHNYKPEEEKLRKNYTDLIKYFLEYKELTENIESYLKYKEPYFKEQRKKTTNNMYTYIVVDELLTIIKKFKSKQIDKNLNFCN